MRYGVVAGEAAAELTGPFRKVPGAVASGCVSRATHTVVEHLQRQQTVQQGQIDVHPGGPAWRAMFDKDSRRVGSRCSTSSGVAAVSMAPLERNRG